MTRPEESAHDISSLKGLLPGRFLERLVWVNNDKNARSRSAHKIHFPAEPSGSPLLFQCMTISPWIKKVPVNVNTIDSISKTSEIILHNLTGGKRNISSSSSNTPPGFKIISTKMPYRKNSVPLHIQRFHRSVSSRAYLEVYTMLALVGGYFKSFRAASIRFVKCDTKSDIYFIGYWQKKKLLTAFIICLFLLWNRLKTRKNVMPARKAVFSIMSLFEDFRAYQA